MKYRRVAGFEGDIHDSVTVHVHGEVSELRIFTANVNWGPVKPRPDDWPVPALGDTVSERGWQCSEDSGHDFRLRKGDRNWRMRGFAKGFAEYKDVSSKAAEQFDRVIDSLCCAVLPWK